jgi:cytochrome c oxidase cbb3-type subunit 2
MRYCAWCHGEHGDGRGPSNDRYAVKPTSFTLGVYKCRSTPTGTPPTDDDLRRSIRRGLYGTGMPRFAALGPLQIDGLVETMRHFSPQRMHERPGTPIEVPKEPTNDPASVARGREVYDRMKCASCHGERGEGGPAAVNLRNDDGSIARVTDFTQKDALKCGRSPARIYTTLMTGLDGTPMAAYAEAVTPEEAWDMVHYLMSLRR